MTPQHLKAGAPRHLNEAQVDDLVAFATSSALHRRLTYKQLKQRLYPNDDFIGVDSIKGALNRRGYHRCAALKKPPLSPVNRQKRLDWAWEHLNWTIADWERILWSDETWVSASNHRKVLVTRRPGEELLDDCLLVKGRRGGGWMFWACFNGEVPGPHLFWEKDWGTIN